MKLYPTATKLYIAESGRVRTPTSEQTIRKVLRLAQSQWPDQHLGDFTTEQLTWFCLNRFDGNDGLPAPKTIQQRRSYLRAVFDWFRWKKLIDVDPSLDLKHTVVPGNHKVRVGNWLTEAEVSEVFRSFDTSNPVQRRNRLIFLFGVSTGLRLQELAQLTWDKFTKDLKTVRVLRKGNVPMDITIPPQLHQVLSEWKREAWMGATAVFPAVKEAFDFGQLKRRQTLRWDIPLGTDGIRYVVRAACKDLGVRVNPHDLRRTIAGILETKGVALKDIQAHLGHKHLATTDSYLKNNPARAERVANGLALEL